MKTTNGFTNPRDLQYHRLAAWVGVLLLALPVMAQAQFNYVVDYDGTIIITGYTGPGGAVTIPDTLGGLTVTRIGDGAFYNGAGNLPYVLTSVTIPDTVYSIGSGAFAWWTGLTNVSLGEDLESIGDSAFADCGLYNVTIPSGVTGLGSGAFEYCGSLNGVFFEGDAPSPEDLSVFYGDNNYVYHLSGTFGWGPTYGGRPTATWGPGINWIYSTNNGAISISRYIGPGGVVNIPSTINGLPVTSLGDNAFWNCASLTSISIPNGVTSIGYEAFSGCTSLTNLSMGNGVTSIGSLAFTDCISLPNVTVGDGVTNIGSQAFFHCINLTSVIIPASVTHIDSTAFGWCYNLAGLYFQGNAPSLGSSLFENDTNAIVYYLPGTTGWGPTFGGLPAMPGIPPSIQIFPQTQTAEAGSIVELYAQSTNTLPLSYLWYFNGTNFISGSTNNWFELTNAQFSPAGTYMVVISNALGAVTSAPAMLQVISLVERRPVPGINLMGEAGSILNVDYASALGSTPGWTTLDTVYLTNASQFYFDLTTPLPPQRFYRAWQTGTPLVPPSLELHFAAALTLTGNIGDNLRLDYINQFGPTDAWVTLVTVTLTNTTQLYFDVSSIGQPPRLWRIVPVP